MFQRTGRGFCDRSRQPDRATIRNEDPVGASRLSGSKHRTEVVWVFDSVQDQHQGGLVARSRVVQNFVLIRVGFRRNQPDDTLMLAVRNQPIQNRPRLEVDRDLC
jgi:hypothetical protein